MSHFLILKQIPSVLLKMGYKENSSQVYLLLFKQFGELPTKHIFY